MSPVSFSKLDVLVVDPSQHMANLVVSMLRHLKVGVVEEAYTSASALAKLEQRRFDVVVIEDNIAPVDGVEVTRALRAKEHCVSRDAAVIMMANSPGLARITEARDAGITEFLRKPFATQHLATRLESIVARPRDFIDVDNYVGPDRRRQTRNHGGEDRRRGNTKSA